MQSSNACASSLSADIATWGAAYTEDYAHKSQQNRKFRGFKRPRPKPSPEFLAILASKLAAARARMHHLFNLENACPGFTLGYWNFIRLHAKADISSVKSDAKLVERADNKVVFADMRRERRVMQQAMVRDRLSYGYRSLGGAVGGNPLYRRASFVYRGLVSDEHPILKLIAASTPQAKHLVTGPTKVGVSCVGQKILALDDCYVVTNGEMRRVMRVELDRVFDGGFNELKKAIEALGLPLPNLAVGYVDSRGRLHNPHVLWLLEHSVAFTKKGRQAPQKLFDVVLRGLTAAMLPLGADIGGLSNSRRIKNPLSPEWDRAILAEVPYVLMHDTRENAAVRSALATDLNLDGVPSLLRSVTEARKNKILSMDHPDPAVAAQSNAVFFSLRNFAYSTVQSFRDLENTEGDFQQAVLNEGLRIFPSDGTARRHITKTAQAVATWTWKHYRSDRHRNPCSTPEDRQDRQAIGQAKGAASRRNATCAALIQAAKNLEQAGLRVTQDAVAAAAMRSVRTARVYWNIVLDALSDIGSQSSSSIDAVTKVSEIAAPAIAVAVSGPALLSLDLLDIPSPAGLPQRYSRHAAWWWLLSNAASYRMSVSFGERDTLNQKCGQISVTNGTLQQAWSWTGDMVRRFLKNLEIYKLISVELASESKILTIANFEVLVYGKYNVVNQDLFHHPVLTNFNNTYQYKEVLGWLVLEQLTKEENRDCRHFKIFQDRKFLIYRTLDLERKWKDFDDNFRKILRFPKRQGRIEYKFSGKNLLVYVHGIERYATYVCR